MRSLFTNVRSLLSSVKWLLILVPGLGNSENSLPVQEKCLSMPHLTIHLTKSLHARTYARAYIIVAIPTFYVSHLSHLSLVGTILLGQMGQVGHLFLA
jgi:hypothetical protein